jgi:FemAB-related protein (PEP-CTERM system-associated)
MSFEIYEITLSEFSIAIEKWNLEHQPQTTWPWLSSHDCPWLFALQQGLQYEPRCLIARGPLGNIVGMLPLALVQSGLFGRFLVSLPYLNSGGVCTDSPEVAHGLVDQAVELADQLDVKHLELRHEIPIEHPKLTVSRTDKVHMRLELEESPEAQMKTYKSKLRSQIKKNSENPFEIHFGAQEFLPDFYKVFATNMRDLGTPVYSPKLFEAILKNFGPETAEIALVRLHGQSVAGALLIHQRGTSQVPSASSLRRFNSTGANLWMYSKLLDRAIEKKSQRFDFGRSTIASGTYKFKEQWGAKASPAVWQYYVRKGDPATMRPDSPKKQRLIQAWKTLPVWLSKILGPPIVRGIP